jgi:hypothetical protein
MNKKAAKTLKVIETTFQTWEWVENILLVLAIFAFVAYALFKAWK